MNHCLLYFVVSDGEPQFIAVPQEEKVPLILDTRKASPEYDDPTQCIVAQKEMDMNAGREESESEDKSHPAVFETTAVKPQAGISNFWANIRILESESHSIINVEELV